MRARVAELERELAAAEQRNSELLRYPAGGSERFVGKFLFGAPLDFSFEREVEGELPASAQATIVAALSARTQAEGVTRPTGNGFVWSLPRAPKAGPRLSISTFCRFTKVTVRSSERRTKIRVEGTKDSLTGGLVVLVPAAVVVALLFVFILAPTFGPIAPPIVATIFFALVFALAESTHSRRVSDLSCELKTIADEIVKISRRAIQEQREKPTPND